MKPLKKALMLLKGKKPRHPRIARLLHWTYAPAVVINALSGSYITRPTRSRGFRSMDSARKTHFISMYVLLFSYLARVYYGYAAKNYGEIIPGPKDMERIPEFLKYEFFLTKKKPKFPKYNPLQKIVFTSFALLIPVQIVTGFALYALKTWQKTSVLAGGLNPLRKLHYLATIAINTLLAGHTYFALTDDLKKFKSIFTGYE